MPAGRFKSRTFRRVKKVTPGHNVVTHYRPRKPSKAKCSNCGAILPGVANERPHKMQNMPKTKKRPERPFGGVLCTKCSRAAIKAEAKNNVS